MAEKKVTRLSELDAKEVSFVPKGANGRRIILTKESGSEMKEAIKKLLEMKIENEAELVAQIDTFVASVAKEDTDKDALKTQTLAAYKILKSFGDKDQVAKAYELLGELAGISKAEPTNSGKTTTTKEAPAMTTAQVKSVEDVQKELREEFAAVNKEKDTQIEKLQKELSVERDSRVLKEFEAKAIGFGFTGEQATAKAALLKEASEKMSKEGYQAFEDTIKAAAVLKTSPLFKELGSSNGGSNALDTKVATLKESIRKEQPSLTDAQAEAKVFEMNKDLYKEYLDANKAQGGY